MRKYRCWDISAEKYFEVRAIDFHSNMIEWYDPIENRHGRASFDDVVIEQDTGFVDYNGRTVYEGDIVEFFDKEEWYRTSIEKGILSPEQYQTWLMYQPTEKVEMKYDLNYGYEFYDRELKDYWQVIGNIHENKEVLIR